MAAVSTGGEVHPAEEFLCCWQPWEEVNAGNMLDSSLMKFQFWSLMISEQLRGGAEWHLDVPVSAEWVYPEGMLQWLEISAGLMQVQTLGMGMLESEAICKGL